MPRRRSAATVGIRGSTHDHTPDSGATQQQQQLPPHKRVTSPNPQTSEASRNTHTRDTNYCSPSIPSHCCTSSLLQILRGQH